MLGTSWAQHVTVGWSLYPFLEDPQKDNAPFENPRNGLGSQVLVVLNWVGP